MDWKHLGIQILGYLLPVMAALLTALGSWGLTMLAKKFGLDIDLRKDAMIRNAVRNGIAAAEEWGQRQIKDEDNGPSGAAKLEWAKGLIMKQWPKMLPEDLDRMLDEELAQMQGPGATGDKALR